MFSYLQQRLPRSFEFLNAESKIQFPRDWVKNYINIQSNVISCRVSPGSLKIMNRSGCVSRSSRKICFSSCKLGSTESRERRNVVANRAIVRRHSGRRFASAPNAPAPVLAPETRISSIYWRCPTRSLTRSSWTSAWYDPRSSELGQTLTCRPRRNISFPSSPSASARRASRGLPCDAWTLSSVWACAILQVGVEKRRLRLLLNNEDWFELRRWSSFRRLKMRSYTCGKFVFDRLLSLRNVNDVELWVNWMK